MALQRGAHIAAVPLNGQESPRAERTDCAKKQRLRTMPDLVGGLHYTLEFSSASRESDLLVELIHRQKSELFDLRKRSCDQKTSVSQREFHGNPPSYP
jgi:hypothetical protein